MKNDFYDYGMAEKYDEAVRNNDEAQIVKIEHEFYEQYKPLVIKMRKELEKRLNKTYVNRDRISKLLAEYEFDAYEQVTRAVRNINIAKIPKKTDKNGKRTWKFYAPCWGYLMSYNRDITREAINASKNERLTSFISSNDDESKAAQSCLQNEASLKSEDMQAESPEKIYIAKAEKDAFWSAVDVCLNKKFNDIQVKIWNEKKEKADKASMASMSRQFGLSIKRIKEETASMKDIFYKELQKRESRIL